MEIAQTQHLTAQTDVMTETALQTLIDVLMNVDWEIQWKGQTHVVNVVKNGFTFEFKKGGNWLGRCSYIFHRSGRATTYQNTPKSKILLNSNWIELNYGGQFLFQFEDTIRHEIAHAIHVILKGTTDHSNEWKSIARQVLADPNRVADEDEIYGMKVKSPYKSTCKNCGKVRHQWRKPKRKVSCGKCSNVYDERYVLQIVDNRWYDEVPETREETQRDKFRYRGITLRY